MDRKKTNHKNNTNQTKDNIYRYTRKSTEKHIKRINKMMRSEEKITFRNAYKYLWSLIVLGINWMVYKKLFVVLLTVMVLVGALVYLPILGIILCLLTPIFLGMYGKRFYVDIANKYEHIEKNEEERLLIPSSILIIWILIIAVIILVIMELI